MAEEMPHRLDDRIDEMRALISRRKLTDAAFGFLGLFLVAASLMVLVTLFGQLTRDGFKRLGQTHLVKESSFAPGRFEVAGKLIREEKPAGVKWSLAREMPVEGQPNVVELDMSAAEADYSHLAGQNVAVDAGRSKTPPLKVRTMEKVVAQSFFGSMPSREARRAGIKSPLVGSILVVMVTMLLSVPLGVAAGIYLEEYAPKNRLTALIEVNIANLAGVPSIIWGLMALGLFVYYLNMGRSILTAGMTLGLLVLPIVIIATREAIRAIPVAIREASYACGASKWETVRHHVVPYSMGGILTGSIIGLSRAIGETAPLITIGALTYIPFLPEFSWNNPFAWLTSQFTVMPIQMFNWISRPDRAFHENAAAAGMVLLVLTLSLNAVAIVLRYRLRKKIKW